MEPTHRPINTQVGNGAKEGGQILYKQISQYQQCDGNATRSSVGNIRVKTDKNTTNHVFQVVNDLVDIPAEEYLSPASTRTRALHSKKLRQYPINSETFKYSFFPRTIPAWNSLPATIAEAPDLVHFKQGLSSLTF